MRSWWPAVAHWWPGVTWQSVWDLPLDVWMSLVRQAEQALEEDARGR